MIKKLLPYSFLFLLGACTFNNEQTAKLPIYGDKKPKTVTDANGKQQTDTVYHTIPAFAFVNQYGDSITNKSLDGNIYVADFFFTSCPSICPVMHRNMLKVYNEYKDKADVKILSYSIDPKYDSVPVLKKYADNLGIAGNTWWLLQGDKKATYDLSKSYLVTTPQEDEKEKFIHDGYFILIDKQKRIRGIYNGTDEKEVAKLVGDIKILLADPEQATKW